MATSQINLEQRTRLLGQRNSSALQRCLDLQKEAEPLCANRRNIDSMTRGLVVADLIDEARTKLVECQLSSSNVDSQNDLAVAHLAIYERRVSSATDLLNRAQLILDFQQDIWGKPLPTGGLWDK